MLDKPGLIVTGAVDIDQEKVGKDLGLLAGAKRRLNVLVTHDIRTALNSRPDVVVHSTSSLLRDVSDQLQECLQASTHVLSTCEELAYPFRKHPDLSEQLDRCAREHNAVLLGTGVNPGFAMDKLVLTIATACHRVTKVKVRRVVDASRRRLPLQKKVGAGFTLEEFRARVGQGVIKHHGLPESVAMIADSLGLPADSIEESIEPVIASETVRAGNLEIPRGRVLGIHQVAHGVSQGTESICLELEMYVGAPEPVDAITIEGLPDLKLAIPGGIHGDYATVAIAVNCIPALLEARPGLRISRDIPMSYLSGSTCWENSNAPAA
jgi:4-hydroxy-tetrahydrodipicolinate reductase